jgi:hypothetical protein
MTHAHAIMTGARFTTVNLCLSASSSEISWKSRPPPSNAAASSSSADGVGRYSFFSNRGDDDDDDSPAGIVVVVVVVVSPYLRFFRGEDDVDADDDEGGDDEGGCEDDGNGSGARFTRCFFGFSMNLRQLIKSVMQSCKSVSSVVSWSRQMDNYRGRLSGCVIYVLIAIAFGS